jgi:hypothetical protein
VSDQAHESGKLGETQSEQIKKKKRMTAYRSDVTKYVIGVMYMKNCVFPRDGSRTHKPFL